MIAKIKALLSGSRPGKLNRRKADSQAIFWGAANGGVTNGGLRGVCPPVLEIGRNRPFSPFFCLFRPFPEGLKGTWKIQKTEEKGLFPQISSDFLKPPSLQPPFAALQNLGCFCEFGVFFLEKQGEFTKIGAVRESAFFWFGLPGRLLILEPCF